MENSGFGERLRKAFGGAKQVEIARKMGVSESAVKNYVSGRVPDHDKLLLIKNLTNCDLDWLLTGNEPQTVSGVMLPSSLLVKLTAIAEEQSHVIWADAILGANNFTERTLELLVEYLIARALAAVGLIQSESAVMTKDRLKRAQKFAFAASAPSVLESYIRGIVKDAAPLGKTDEVRDMIREIVKEEVETSRKRPLYQLDLTDKEKTRKTG